MRHVSSSISSAPAVLHAKADVLSPTPLLANAHLASYHNSPFVGRFGIYGVTLYVPDSIPSDGHAFLGLRDPNVSILQKNLLDAVVGRSIGEDANRLFKIMSLTQRQFLSHVPAHYGQLLFLDQAIECLVARLHQTIPLVKPSIASSSAGLRSPAALYSKALQSLRVTIENDLVNNLSYVWFATMVLQLFEVRMLFLWLRDTDKR